MGSGDSGPWCFQGKQLPVKLVPQPIRQPSQCFLARTESKLRDQQNPMRLSVPPSTSKVFPVLTSHKSRENRPQSEIETSWRHPEIKNLKKFTFRWPEDRPHDRNRENCEPSRKRKASVSVSQRNRDICFRKLAHAFVGVSMDPLQDPA